jgi:hypothetical protein
MRPTVHRWWRPALLGAAALLVAAGYQVALFWVNYGPVPNHEPWLLALLALPVGLAVTAGPGAWDRRTVAALLTLGIVAAFVGVVGYGRGAADVLVTGPDAYHAFRYDWTTNTLRYGDAVPGGTPVGSVSPNRPSALLGTVALALGGYGWEPRKRRALSSSTARDGDPVDGE